MYDTYKGRNSPLTKICTLASGSSGNALLIRSSNTNLLIDAGISVRRINTALRTFDLSIADLDALLITHSHGDHTCALTTLIKHYDLPIYASDGTAFTLSNHYRGISSQLHSFSAGDHFSIGETEIRSFSTSHDAGDCVCYRVDCEDGSVGLLTDTGYVTAQAESALKGVSMLVLEANHDIETLQSGPYPYYLQQRILGSSGHLSNHAAAEFAVTCAKCGTKDFLLAHLSQDNNTPVMAFDTVRRALDLNGCEDVSLAVAPRSETSPIHTL